MKFRKSCHQFNSYIDVIVVKNRNIGDKRAIKMAIELLEAELK